MEEHRLFAHEIGLFVFNSKSQIVESLFFSSGQSDPEKEDLKKRFIAKHGTLSLFHPSKDPKATREALAQIISQEHISLLRQRNLALTKHSVKESTTPDILIIQAVKSITQIEDSINSLSSRLREWYAFSHPELTSSSLASGELFEILLSHDSEKKKSGFGSILSPEDALSLENYARELKGLHSLKQGLESYVEKRMEQFCPNLKAVAGATLGGKILEHAGSLRRLVELPASTIQILGAEKALFRHLKMGARPPKHGILLAHSLVQSVPKPKQGKAARIVAEKISLAVRIDYFKGEFFGDKLVLDAKKKLGI